MTQERPFLYTNVAICILLLIFFAYQALASGPIYTHPQPTQEEFRIIYTEKADARTTPKITVATTTPTFAPEKTGDIFINTSTGKVYIATGTADSGSFAIMN